MRLAQQHQPTVEMAQDITDAGADADGLTRAANIAADAREPQIGHDLETPGRGRRRIFGARRVACRHLYEYGGCQDPAC